jgi:hypothetical protein
VEVTADETLRVENHASGSHPRPLTTDAKHFGVIEQEFRGRGMRAEEFWAAAHVVIAKGISGGALAPSEPGFLGRLAEGESGKFMERIVEEILMENRPDSGPVVDYDVNAPDGSRIEVRNPKPN